jgi:hypothetical protein
MPTNFDIGRTPTLEAVATGDEQALAQDLQARVAELLKSAEEQPEVVEAAESQRGAADRLEKLRVSQRTLNQFAKDARERLATSQQTAIESAIESAATLDNPSGKLSFGKLTELVTHEYHDRLASRALEHVAEHLIPLAQIGSLRAESHAMLATGRALERIAQSRAEKLLSHMSDAVKEEMVLPVDLSKGVVGALLAQADGLKRRAIQLSQSADEFERAHMSRQKTKEGRA